MAMTRRRGRLTRLRAASVAALALAIMSVAASVADARGARVRFNRIEIITVQGHRHLLKPGTIYRECRSDQVRILNFDGRAMRVVKNRPYRVAFLEDGYAIRRVALRWPRSGNLLFSGYGFNPLQGHSFIRTGLWALRVWQGGHPIGYASERVRLRSVSC